MSRQYVTHLCTFMGRQNNLNILLQYIEKALKIEAMDNYWMIDMTRNMKDHEFIFSEQQRLNDLFPGRVHMYNRDVRRKLLDKGEDAIKGCVGSWGDFYSFLGRFSDKDVIAKCDDDTLYIDVETLKGAFEYRWKNKRPYLMHANCINNGVAAYHQYKKDIWKNKELNVYPSCGLTGPLFSHPHIACEQHKKFTRDLIESSYNIEKYKLKQNILFQQRVSINFIFMLGSDRNTLKTIDLQDEYETSSKKPQMEDRPNCLIGDFTVAHHTYGVQEPVMEELGTYLEYKKLAMIMSSRNDHKNKEITDNLLHPVTLSIKDKTYLAKSPYNPNTKILQHVESGLYISVRGNKRERVRLDKDRNIAPTGDYMLQNEVYGDESSLNAVLMDLNFDEPTLLEFSNSDKLICTGGNRKEIEENHKPGRDIIPGHMIAKFFQGGYKTELANIIKQPSGNYRIQSNTHKNLYLNVIVNKNTSRMNLRWENDINCEFNIIDMSNKTNYVESIRIHRCDDNLIGDDTYYTIVSNKRKIYKPREFYWMVDHYIWEIVNIDDKHVKFKLVADGLEPLFLSYRDGKLITDGIGVKWEIYDQKTFKHGDMSIVSS